MIIEKQKNNKVYIQLSNLEDVSITDIQNRIVDISKIFILKINYIRLTSSSNEIVKYIKNTFDIENILLLNKKNSVILYFKLEIEKIYKLLAVLNIDNKSMIEIFNFEHELDLPLFAQSQESESICYICISDNDGPFIIFDKNKYNITEVASKIKNILKS